MKVIIECEMADLAREIDVHTNATPKSHAKYIYDLYSLRNEYQISLI